MRPQETTTLVAPAMGCVTPDSPRRQLLARMQQDREELAQAAAQLRGPVQRVELLKDLLVLATRALPWLPTVGALALWIGRGKRPPVTVLLGLSVQLMNAWIRHPPRAVGTIIQRAPVRGALVVGEGSSG